MVKHNEALDLYRQTKEFASLNGLRAISVIAVMWHHAAGTAFISPEILRVGYHGVSLFFLISGFLITTLLIREKQRNGKIDLAAFFARRAFRIFPLYFGVLALYILLVILFEKNFTARNEFFKNLPFFLTFSTNLFVALEGRVIFYFAWSLAAEEQFYLICGPLLAILRSRTYASVSAVVLTAICASTLLGIGVPEISKVAPVGLWLGSSLALALHYPRTFGLIEKLAGSKSSSVIYGICTLLALEFHLFNDLLFMLSATLFLASCVVREDHFLNKLFKAPPLNFMGRISYGMYLLHMLCSAVVIKFLAYLNATTSVIWIFVCVLILTIIVASTSFFTFEKYFIKLKGRFER
jgi:peptidoglycan/LPS O-acetylase OafA/YrhL